MSAAVCPDRTGIALSAVDFNGDQAPVPPFVIDRSGGHPPVPSPGDPGQGGGPAGGCYHVALTPTELERIKPAALSVQSFYASMAKQFAEQTFKVPTQPPAASSPGLPFYSCRTNTAGNILSVGISHVHSHLQIEVPAAISGVLSIP